MLVPMERKTTERRLTVRDSEYADGVSTELAKLLPVLYRARSEPAGTRELGKPATISRDPVDRIPLGVVNRISRTSRERHRPTCSA